MRRPAKTLSVLGALALLAALPAAAHDRPADRTVKQAPQAGGQQGRQLTPAERKQAQRQRSRAAATLLYQQQQQRFQEEDRLDAIRGERENFENQREFWSNRQQGLAAQQEFSRQEAARQAARQAEIMQEDMNAFQRSQDIYARQIYERSHWPPAPGVAPGFTGAPGAIRITP